jgi:hypothetical protein
VSSKDDKLELIALGIATRFKYGPGPPLTTAAVLATLFQSKFALALNFIVIDPGSTIVENYTATRVLCHKFRVSEVNMQNCLRTIGSRCTKTFAGVKVIANITLRHKSRIYQDSSKKDKDKHQSRDHRVNQHYKPVPEFSIGDIL